MASFWTPRRTSVHVLKMLMPSSSFNLTHLRSVIRTICLVWKLLCIQKSHNAFADAFAYICPALILSLVCYLLRRVYYAVRHCISYKLALAFANWYTHRPCSSHRFLCVCRPRPSIDNVLILTDGHNVVVCVAAHFDDYKGKFINARFLCRP